MAALYGLIEANFRVKRWDIRTALDYDAKEPTVYLKAALSLAVWEIVFIILALGIKVLKIYKRHKKAADAAIVERKAAE